MLPEELKNIDFEELEQTVIPDIRRAAKEKKRNLTIEDCKSSREDFVKVIRKGITISIEHDITKTFGILMLGVKDIKSFTVIGFIIFTHRLLVKLLDGLRFIIFCCICILLSSIVTSNFRSRLRYIFEDWTLDMVIRDTE